jgi:DNA-binding MarR family transcriptional regulator
VHHRILYFVARYPGLPVGELLRRLEVTKQALHRPLRDLIERKLVRLARDSRDGRVRRLTASREGRELEARLSGIQHARLRRIFREAGPRAEAGWRAVMGLMGDRPAVLEPAESPND